MNLQQHVLVVPLPAQGHVKPLMKLAYNLAYHGIKATFANSQFVEAKILAAMSEADKEQCPIRLVSYWDGMESHPEERFGPVEMDSLKKVMTKDLEKLIEQINQSDKEPITCVMVDLTVGWTLEVARNMGLKQVAVWLAGPASLALALRIPKLIEAGVIDENGSTIKNELICLSKGIPVWNSWELTWSTPVKYDEDGIISRHEIKTKIHNLLTNYEMKINAIKLMEDAKKSVSQGGSSHENFKSLVKYLKA
ncbi:hypothetical protein ACET3Z_027190 [Daucus carota]